jgi:hypothetical protein
MKAICGMFFITSFVDGSITTSESSSSKGPADRSCQTRDFAQHIILIKPTRSTRGGKRVPYPSIDYTYS